MKVRLLWPVSHIFTVVCCKFHYFKNFNLWKMLKTLKIGCFMQNYCISVMPQGIPYSNAIFYSTVVKVRLLWPVSQIFTVVCSKFYYFKNFNRWKMLKMLKIRQFWAVLSKITVYSGMPQGIPMQFFAQQWWKSGYCDQFHTYSQWFAVNFIISKISISCKMLKMLKISSFELF